MKKFVPFTLYITSLYFSKIVSCNSFDKTIGHFCSFSNYPHKKIFLSWSMSNVQPLFRPPNINLLAYWYFQFLKILDNPTLYCSTGMTKPPIDPFSLISKTL